MALSRMKGELAKTFLRVFPKWYVRYRFLREYARGDPPLRILQTCVRPGDLVVDIGASIGTYTYRLRQLVGSTGHVHTFEPRAAALEILRATFGREGNVTIYPVALSDQCGEGELYVPFVGDRWLGPMASLAAPPHSDPALTYESVTIKLERLDSIIPLDKQRVSLIKCDAEGHEFQVLRGAEAVLRRYHPILIIEIEQRHQSGDIWDTLEYIKVLGYRGYSLHHRSGPRPLELFDVRRDQLAYLHEGFESVMPRGYVADFLFVPTPD